VRDNFVRPFIAAFPGNVHTIRNLAHADNLVAVEWSFDAVHKGAFGKIEATGKKVQVPGCSFYEYDLGPRKIPAGRIYFDFATLLRQIGASASETVYEYALPGAAFSIVPAVPNYP
jgi:predicted ester cyclase